MSDVTDMLDDFRDESSDLLQLLEDSLLDVQENGVSNELINTIFRAVHTIKGIAGMFNFSYIVSFTHLAENLLDKIRNEEISMDERMVGLFLKTKDHLSNLVDAVLVDPDSEPEEESEMDILSKKLTKIFALLIRGDDKEEDDSSEDDGEEKIRVWKLIISPSTKGVKFNNIEPAHFITYLNDIGTIESLKLNLDDIPSLKYFEIGVLYLTFEIIFKSIIHKEEIEKVFDFIATLCRCEIDEYDRREGARRDEKEEEQKTEEDNRSKGSDRRWLDEKEAEEKADETQQLEEVEKNTKEVIEKKNIAITKAVEKKDAALKKVLKKSTTLRVDADRVDTLINLIGEMVISNANVVQKAMDLNDKELIESTSVLTRMLEDVRETGMKMRMMPVGDTFNKFKRIVHDVSAKLGKKIDFKVFGGDTELDKTLIEKISDALVHLIRNSVDHGVESIEDRIKAGKPEKGVVSISAAHEAGSIAIIIEDDGKGLDTEILFNKAVEKELIDKDDELSDKEIYNLILKPGFSTAEVISDISGRGVGMEVVKKNIDALRGEIDIDSELGVGTKISIRLPLTLAIIDGFMVSVGDTFFVIPLDMIMECIKLTEENESTMHGNNFINLRGSVLPLLNMNEYAGIVDTSDDKTDPDERKNIVIVQYAGQVMGLVVDQLHGEFQTVIKPLGKIFENVTGLSGATILGSGEVALILDIPVLNQYAKRSVANSGL